MPTEQANPTTVFKAKTISRKVALIFMDVLLFNSILFTTIFLSFTKCLKNLPQRTAKTHFLWFPEQNYRDLKDYRRGKDLAPPQNLNYFILIRISAYSILPEMPAFCTLARLFRHV